MKIEYRPDKSSEFIPYVVKGSKITFDDEVMLNVARYERDEPNHIDVCRDRDGNLVSGVIPGIAESYVAQIDIPARRYQDIPAPADAGEGGGESAGGTTREALPFDMNKCTLTLWKL